VTAFVAVHPPIGSVGVRCALVALLVTAWAVLHAQDASVSQTTAGRPTSRRLTRVEYTNAIRDLLDLEIDGDSLLPADEALAGFDNIAGALSVSPALLERYLAAASRISRLAVGDPGIGPAFAAKTYQVPQDNWQDSRVSEDLPFGSRGGIAVRHRFPLDGEYVCRIVLRRNVFGYVRGVASAHQLDVRLDGALVKTFSVGGASKGAPSPLSFTGVVAGDPEWEAYAISADAGLELRLRAPAGTHLLGVSFRDEMWEDDGIQQPPLSGLGLSYDESRSSPRGPWGPAVDRVEIGGPFNPTGSGDTASRRRIFTCGLAPRSGGRGNAGVRDDDCARQIVSSLARRAYRRPPTTGEVQQLLEFFRDGFARAGFEIGIQSAIERMLVDPSFLFHGFYAAGGSDIEMASRLSFFLWSSIPDDELLERAVAGDLHEPADVLSQVRRMLVDRRSSALVDNFAVQWLSLRRLAEVKPDPEVFADFDGDLRDAFEQETKLFVASQIQEDRGVVDLLTANYTFVNERLARHYEIPGIYGGHFRRVMLDQSNRGGLLAQGSVLTLTSYPMRTSPVVRGRWLLDTLFGSAPPPPPADVPPLPPATSADRLLSVRERTERHRTNPVCAGCHVRMDPLGFALENFDGVGRWRVQEDGRPIDASGRLPDGSSVQGIEGLRALVSRQPVEFVSAVTTKLMTYATGRTVESAERPSIQQIVRDAAPDGYRWSSLLRGVVESDLFRK
jgi:hypothetical protein